MAPYKIAPPALNHLGINLKSATDPFDVSVFTAVVPVWAARIPARLVTPFTKDQAVRPLVFKPPRMSAIARDDETHRLVFLGDQLEAPVLKKYEGTLVSHELRFGYEYWTVDDILSSVLPLDLVETSPASYAQVGHIGHLNLRDRYLPYKYLIGRVILEKNKTLETIVNKTDTIDNTYRNFKMEVLAGEDRFDVKVSESDCIFTFDFSKVYWNSRLQMEHLKLVSMFEPTDVIVDSFAGVGPFAIPAAKKGCGVIASDLNPSSAESLVQNVVRNHVEDTCRAGCKDGRDGIRDSVIELWEQPFQAYRKRPNARERKKRAAALAAGVKESDLGKVDGGEEAGGQRNLANHFVMNLPGSAIEFLDAYSGLYKPLVAKHPEALDVIEANPLPMVHCYCFTKEIETAEEDILERAQRYLGHPITKEYNVRYVRDVAPKKEMYCLEFRLQKSMVL